MILRLFDVLDDDVGVTIGGIFLDIFSVVGCVCVVVVVAGGGVFRDVKDVGDDVGVTIGHGPGLGM